MSGASPQRRPQVDAALVRRIANLAALDLDESELPKWVEDFGKMLDLIDALGDDSDRPGPDPASGSESNAAASCRSGDQSLERADAEVYLRRAPARDGDYFVVPRVVGE